MFLIFAGAYNVVVCWHFSIMSLIQDLLWVITGPDFPHPRSIMLRLEMVGIPWYISNNCTLYFCGHAGSKLVFEPDKVKVIMYSTGTGFVHIVIVVGEFWPEGQGVSGLSRLGETAGPWETGKTIPRLGLAGPGITLARPSLHPFIPPLLYVVIMTSSVDDSGKSKTSLAVFQES